MLYYNNEVGELRVKKVSHNETSEVVVSSYWPKQIKGMAIEQSKHYFALFYHNDKYLIKGDIVTGKITFTASTRFNPINSMSWLSGFNASLVLNVGDNINQKQELIVYDIEPYRVSSTNCAPNALSIEEPLVTVSSYAFFIYTSQDNVLMLTKCPVFNSFKSVEIAI